MVARWHYVWSIMNLISLNWLRDHVQWCVVVALQLKKVNKIKQIVKKTVFVNIIIYY